MYIHQINIQNTGRSFGFKIYDGPDEFRGVICQTCRVKDVKKGLFKDCRIL